MSKDDKSLQKVSDTNRLPAYFDQLEPEQKRQVLLKIVEGDVGLRQKYLAKLSDSHIAEHDLAVIMQTIRDFDQNKKVYSVKGKATTGSGNVEVTVRGGDTRFIVPIILAIGVVIILLLLVLSKCSGNNKNYSAYNQYKQTTVERHLKVCFDSTRLHKVGMYQTL